MRIGRGRHPRRRDPRRRFRNRLLVGMVGVALLPLVAFAVLAVFELDAVAKSTANATEAAILARQQTIADTSLDVRASSLDNSMSAIDSAVQEGLGGALTRALAAVPKGATAPPLTFALLGPSFQYAVTTGATGSTLILPDGKINDVAFIRASESPTVVAQVNTVIKSNPAIATVWFTDAKTGAIRAYPNFDPTTQSYDPVLRAKVLSESEGGIPAASAPNVWVQPGAPGRSTDGPFWSDPYPLLADGTAGVSAWYQDPSSIQVGVDVSVSKLIGSTLLAAATTTVDPLLISATGTVLYGSSQAEVDFPSASFGAQFTTTQRGLSNSIRHMWATGVTSDTPLTATFGKDRTDIFTSPVFSGHWIIVNPVPVNSLEPNLLALTLGVNDSVHRLFPVTVLPVLILLVGLAFIATTLLSRRMYLPVQALTDHAVLEERTRLAREIHDTLAQQLTGIVLELEAADTLLNRGSERRAKTSVEKARELARGALQEARRSVWNLRPAPLSATGLVAAIGHEVEAWEERTGIPARFRARAVPQHSPLSPTAEVALLRIGQEALSNAARHGKPEHVDVELRTHAQELILSISDDGVGFDPSAAAPREDCFGLDGMAERARNAGGTLTVVSAPGQGTTITTRLPFTEAAVEAVSA
jgi:signal transduction histidine kinase